MRLKIRLAAAFAVCTAIVGSARAEDLVIDAAQWGNVNLVVRQSLGGDLESILSRSGNHERLDTYDEQARFRKLSRPVGRLDVRFQSGEFVTCTATIVEESVILTNHHCIPNTAATTARLGPVTEAALVMNYYTESRTSSVRRYRVDLNPIAASGERDYSYLRVEGAPGREWGVATIRRDTPRPGASLLIVHHPGGLVKHVTRGNCRASRPAVDDRGIELFHVCDTLPGSSGAPIFSDDDGAVIGIHRAGATVTGPGAKNYGVVAAALDRNARGGGVAAGGRGEAGNQTATTPVVARPQGEGRPDGPRTWRVLLDPRDVGGDYKFELVMTDNRHWRQREPDGRLEASFDELFRDEWSIYLRPAYAPHEVIQIDLNTRRVNALVNGALAHVWSDIVEAETYRDGQVGGYDVGVVRYDLGGAQIGSFSSIGGGEWVDNHQFDRYHLWRETQRDDWSVYLQDQNGATVQLDLYKKQVIRDWRGARSPVFKVVAVARGLR
ncbi:MAG: serine protease [Pseudomonadota bacterium]